MSVRRPFRVAALALTLSTCLAIGLAITPGSALAVEPNEVMADPKLEARARIISKDLRCVVCQNQSIDDSNSDLARDLRLLVRERLTKGDTNEEAIQYIVDRYGDFVLLNPPFKSTTYALWFGPAIMGLLGLLAIFGFYRKTKAQAEAGEGGARAGVALSIEEEKRLTALLDETTANEQKDTSNS